MVYFTRSGYVRSAFFAHPRAEPFPVARIARRRDNPWCKTNK